MKAKATKSERWSSVAVGIGLMSNDGSVVKRHYEALLLDYERRRAPPPPSLPPRPAADLFFEIAGELLVPLHVLTAMLKPRHIRWRNRNFVLKGRRIVDG